jgi:hypothetical protein
MPGAPIAAEPPLRHLLQSPNFRVGANGKQSVAGSIAREQRSRCMVPATRRGGGVIVRMWTVVAMALTLACEGGQGQTTPPEVPFVVSPPPNGPLIAQPGSHTVTVTIDLAALRQEMQGFGVSMRIFSDPHLIGQFGSIENSLQITPEDENAILAILYDKIGLTRVRPLHQSKLTQPTPESIPRTDWVFADGHIDLVKRARSMGLREWWLSPQAVEAWMNESTVAAYAEWAMKVIRYWRSQGAELTWYSIVNEPSHPQVNLSGEFLRDAVKLLGRQLAAEGFKTRLVIPDDINPLSGAPKARIVLSDPEARQYVGAIASHLYNYPLSAMREMSAVAAEYKVPLWMSEFSVEGPSPLEWGGIVHRLIAEYNVSAVDYMWGFFGDYDHAQLVSIHHASRQYTGATITAAGYGMAHYAKYVLPGARRVESASSDAAVRATAFIRNGRITIVVLNEGAAPQVVRFAISGAAGLRTVNVIRTSGEEKLAAVGHLNVTDGVFNLELPARSISTLVQ